MLQFLVFDSAINKSIPMDGCNVGIELGDTDGASVGT